VEIQGPEISTSFQYIGVDSYIYNGSNGLTLDVSTTDIAFKNRANPSHPFIAKFLRNGATELYYSGIKKLATVGDGVTVTGIMHGTASEAYYADLAEKYTINDIEQNIVPGHVILISEDENYDGELSNEIGSNRILGVISENPAFKMNSALEEGYYVGLRGRVKCYVNGPVKKGEPLISGLNGTAVSYTLHHTPDNFGKLLGRANESIDNDDTKLIEIII